MFGSRNRLMALLLAAYSNRRAMIRTLSPVLCTHKHWRRRHLPPVWRPRSYRTDLLQKTTTRHFDDSLTACYFSGSAFETRTQDRPRLWRCRPKDLTAQLEDGFPHCSPRGLRGRAEEHTSMAELLLCGPCGDIRIKHSRAGGSAGVLTYRITLPLTFSDRCGCGENKGNKVSLS